VIKTDSILSVGKTRIISSPRA